MNHVNMFCFIDCYGILWYPPIRSNPISTFLFYPFSHYFDFKVCSEELDQKEKKASRKKH